MKRSAFFIIVMLHWGGISTAQQPLFSETSTDPSGVSVYKNLSYAPGGHELQKLDLYVPENGEGPFPLIVWIHGGAWRYGSKENCVALPWAKKGFAVASIGYRLSQHAKFPAQIEDCQAAIGWLRAQARKYNIDEDRVAAWGDSAGGHLASLLGTAGDSFEWKRAQPSRSLRVQAVIDWYGRVDLTRVCTDPSMADSPVAGLLGGSREKIAELARQASPILHVSRDDPPFLIMHGDRDDVVPLWQSVAFEKALKNAGVEANLIVLKGAGHGGREFLKPEHVETINGFLNAHLYMKAPRIGRSLH